MQQYSSTIKQHYHNPLNTGKLADATYVVEELNPLCGDEIKIYIHMINHMIYHMKYEARGCMISIAAASVLSGYVKGKTLFEVKKITKEDIDKLLGVEISQARESCSTLALTAVNKFLR